MFLPLTAQLWLTLLVVTVIALIWAVTAEKASPLAEVIFTVGLIVLLLSCGLLVACCGGAP